MSPGKKQDINEDPACHGRQQSVQGREPESWLSQTGGTSMKLKTRLAVAFMIITIVPIILIFVSFFAINDHQARSFTKEYGLTEQVDLLNGNSTQVFNRLTRRVQQVIRDELDKKPELYEDTY